MCELLVGLPEVTVLGVVGHRGEPLYVHVKTRRERPGCPTCGVVAQVQGHHNVELVDLPCFWWPTRLVWKKVRWHCCDPDCPKVSWTEQDPRIASSRMAMTDRAGRWVTEQVGRCARSVAEVAAELGCDWHTVNDAVVAYGQALVDEPGRYGTVVALGLDEVLFTRRGPYRRQEFATTIADVVEASCSTSFLAGAPRARPRGLRRRGSPGAGRSAGARSISPTRDPRSSRRCSPTPPRWPTRST